MLQSMKTSTRALLIALFTVASAFALGACDEVEDGQQQQQQPPPTQQPPAQ